MISKTIGFRGTLFSDTPISIKIAQFLLGKLSRASGDHHGHGCAEELTSRTAEWLGVAALKGQSDLENPIEIPYVG